MPYKSRGIYKEEGMVRDYNLFVIVAEGSKREVEYLMPFDIVDRIMVVNIPQTTEEKGSYPDHVQARMERYINDEGLSGIDCSKSQNLKNALGALNPGGYNYHTYIPLIDTAIKNARTHDSNP